MSKNSTVKPAMRARTVRGPDFAEAAAPLAAEFNGLLAWAAGHGLDKRQVGLRRWRFEQGLKAVAKRDEAVARQTQRRELQVENAIELLTAHGVALGAEHRDGPHKEPGAEWTARTPRPGRRRPVVAAPDAPPRPQREAAPPPPPSEPSQRPVTAAAKRRGKAAAEAPMPIAKPGRASTGAAGNKRRQPF